MDEITGFSEQAPASAPRARSRFVLTRQNQKGQVAIFVALIFQVIFVFFALLINVGLLVHHKINLQQSTDLAAYYGAMKQAEVMNAIAHVNFQIRQAWKLMTWRYRVLGTFGFMKASTAPPPTTQNFPFEFINEIAGFSYNGKAATTSCPAGAESLGIQDIPFFCLAHAGFNGWPRTENLCKLNCSDFTSARRINSIPTAGIVFTPSGGDVSDDIKAAVDQVNINLTNLCTGLKLTGGSQLARFAASYINETGARSATITMLAQNLSLPVEEFLDIEGKKVIEGSVKTFKHNLTEANLTGFKEDENFTAVNGYSQKCRFIDGKTGGTEFLKKIEFNFINYFIQNCTQTGVLGSGATFDYQPEAIYDNSTGGLTAALTTGPGAITSDLQGVLLSLLNSQYYHTIGYEKNPYCVEYYAVKASSEPNIPFLPLKKIKLTAMATAKPFGGSIGPWYGKQWPKGNQSSVANEADESSRMDETLPMRNITPADDLGNLTATRRTQPNFSLYVGDRLGLRDPDYLAAFHSMLSIRDILNYGSKNYTNVNMANKQENTGLWPAYTNWNNIDNASMPDMRQYDSLASNGNNIGTRALELAAIAPNQFDVTFYSIDPDFYNNYYRKLYNGYDAIRNATSSTSNKNQLRPDFGAVLVDAGNNTQPDPLTERIFSVKDQILVKNMVLNKAPNRSGPGWTGQFYNKILNYLISVQSSLLTGWTFLNFSDYDTFPNQPVDDAQHTMSFGQCNNAWNNTAAALGDIAEEENFRTPMDIESKYPPAQGNCVTGGRTGYSVKLISPSMLRDTTKIENTIDEGFFSF